MVFLDVAEGIIGNGGEIGIDFGSFLPGDWSLVIWAIVLIVGFIILIFVFKHFIANLIAGLVAFAVLVFVFGIPIPITALTVMVTIFGGLGGVGALVVSVFFGWI